MKTAIPEEEKKSGIHSGASSIYPEKGLNTTGLPGTGGRQIVQNAIDSIPEAPAPYDADGNTLLPLNAPKNARKIPYQEAPITRMNVRQVSKQDADQIIANQGKPEEEKPVLGRTGKTKPVAAQPLAIPEQEQVKHEAQRQALDDMASHESNGGVAPRRDGNMLTNVAYPESTQGAYAYSEGNSGNMTPLGGWRNQEDMIADNQRRKVTGKLSNGSTYTYFLKPGEQDLAIPTQQAEFANPVTYGDDRQSGETIARFSQPQGSRSLAQKNRDDAEMRMNAESRKAHEEARKVELTNQLAQQFMKDGDFDTARSMLTGKTGAIPEWKPFTEKTYDDLGMVTGEKTQFYQGQGQTPAIHDPSQVAQRRQAPTKMLDILLAEIKNGNGDKAKKDFQEYYGYLPEGI